MDENLNYPIPDPTWDYAPIWENLQQTKSKFEKLLNYMAVTEDADDSTDREIVTRLGDVISSLQSSCQFIHNFSDQA